AAVSGVRQTTIVRDRPRRSKTRYRQNTLAAAIAANGWRSIAADGRGPPVAAASHSTTAAASASRPSSQWRRIDVRTERTITGTWRDAVLGGPLAATAESRASYVPRAARLAHAEPTLGTVSRHAATAGSVEKARAPLERFVTSTVTSGSRSLLQN